MPRRGLESHPKSKRRAIAKKGGKAAQASGKAHRFTKKQLKKGGQAGGRKTSQNREHMAELGRRSGQARRDAKVLREQQASNARVIEEARPGEIHITGAELTDNALTLHGEKIAEDAAEKSTLSFGVDEPEMDGLIS